MLSELRELSSYLAVSPLRDGVSLHAEHVSGRHLWVLLTDESLAAGLERDPSHGGGRGGAHAAPGLLTVWAERK